MPHPSPDDPSVHLQPETLERLGYSAGATLVLSVIEAIVWGRIALFMGWAQLGGPLGAVGPQEQHVGAVVALHAAGTLLYVGTTLLSWRTLRALNEATARGQMRGARQVAAAVVSAPLLALVLTTLSAFVSPYHWVAAVIFAAALATGGLAVFRDGAFTRR